MKKISYTKYKDSGIEWLGKIPEHWKIKRLKFLLSKPLKYGANESAEYDEPSWPRYVRITDIDENGMLKKETFKSIPKEIAYQYLLKDDDILFARSGATVGKTFLYQKCYGQIAFAGYLIRARFEMSDNIPKFIYYFCQSQVYWKWIKNNSIQATIQNISAEKYSNLYISLPDIYEQKSITIFLNKATSWIDSLIEKIKKSITLLKEYRLALITSAVTGQIDVRKSQAQEITVQAQKTERQKLANSLKVLDFRFRENNRHVGGDKVALALVSDHEFATKLQRDSRFRGNDRRVGGDKVAVALVSDRDSMSKSQKDSRFCGNNKLVAKKRSKKLASPIFKKAVFGAEIVAQLKDDPHFGRTKFMKTLYLCEAHLQIPLKGEYKREAAGPLDSSIYTIEGIMKRNKWFEVVKTGSMFKYKPFKNPDGHKQYFNKYWGDYTKELNRLLSIMKNFTTEQSEIVDTIYAVWNDFLLEGKKPSVSEIVYEVKNNWHKRKKRFSDNQLQKAIQWMKQQNLVPKGYGPKTKTLEETK